MSDLEDIYQALEDGRRSAESLMSWQRGADGRDIVRGRQGTIERGIAAFERLRGQLREGRMHVETPEDFKATGCMCSWPTVSPPCSWCTDPDNHPDDEESPA